MSISFGHLVVLTASSLHEGVPTSCMTNELALCRYHKSIYCSTTLKSAHGDAADAVETMRIFSSFEPAAESFTTMSAAPRHIT